VWLALGFLLVLQKGGGRDGSRLIILWVAIREWWRGDTRMKKGVRRHTPQHRTFVCADIHDAGCVCQSKDGYVCAHVLNRMT
jgi:hypothetical protein